VGRHFVLSRRPLAHLLARGLAIVSSVVHRPLTMKRKFTSVLAYAIVIVGSRLVSEYGPSTIAREQERDGLTNLAMPGDLI